VQWGVEPASAVQMAAFLQQHLQTCEQWKLVHGSKPAPVNSDGVSEMIAALLQGKESA
jgi:hypothetical protein